MFARIKKSGQYQYLQIVENSKIDGKVRQRVVSTVGRLDQLQTKGSLETLIRSLARFSEKTLLVLSGKVDVSAHAIKIGPGLIFDRLWRELGLPAIFRDLLADRKFEFDIERAVFSQCCIDCSSPDLTGPAAGGAVTTQLPVSTVLPCIIATGRWLSSVRC